MNPAEIFLEHFPHASEVNGWSKKNLTEMMRDATTLGITQDEFGKIAGLLLRKPRKASVPSYNEVHAAMEARVRERALAVPDTELQRHREMRQEWTPPTDEEKAWRRACTQALKDGVFPPSFADWQSGGAA